MTKHLAVYGAILVALLVIDGLWLGVIAKSWYQQGIGHLMAPSPNLVAAALFYLLYPLGLMLFGVLPHSDDGLLKVALTGALFGFFAYATYDLSNLATLKDWPPALAVVDIVWGTFLSGVCATAGKLAFNAVR